MKKICLAIASVFVFSPISAQNFVSDPSFEDYDSCHKGPNHNGTQFFLKHWFLPTRGTTDYFNTCANSMPGYGVVGMPGNLRGYQAASDSNGYIGICIYHADEFDYKEYVACKLTGCESGNCPLTPGKYYRVSMDVSLAEDSRTACNGLGAYFLTDTLPTSYKASWITTLPRIAQINYSSYGVIKDTMNWVTLVDTFLADSAYRYMIIGGVLTEPNMSRVTLNSFPVDLSYYFLDNVKVEEVTVTNVQDVEKPVVTFTPNPIKDRAVFNLSKYHGSSYSLSIVNTIGQTVWQRSNVIDSELIFERGSLPTGVYYYQLRMKGRQVLKGKLALE